MIDEELYQQAADELNSDKRRPHIWARACALASDDHDEARFLYTNLRVEELQAQRQQSQGSGAGQTDSTPVVDKTLSLEPLTDDSAVDESTEPDLHIPSSISAPSGVDQPSTKDFASELLSLSPEDNSEDSPESIQRTSFEEQFALNKANEETDEDLPALSSAQQTSSLDNLHGSSQDISEGESDPLDDTYADGDDTIDIFDQEIEAVRAEQGDRDTFLDTGAFSRSLDGARDLKDNVAERAPDDVHALIGTPDENNELDDTDIELDRTTDLNLSDEDIADLTHPEAVPTSPYHSAGLTESSELNDKSREKLDDILSDNYQDEASGNNTLDEVLDDAHYEPPGPVDPNDDGMDWLDETLRGDGTGGAGLMPREPTIFEEDPLTDELERQARELPATDSTANNIIEHDLSTNLTGEIPAAPLLDDVPEHIPVAETAAVAGTAAVASATAASAMANTATEEPSTDGDVLPKYPLDLVDNWHGRKYSVYRRNNGAQAVKQGVSWSALIMTLPYLIYRHLFGTALVYGLMWLIIIGGLIVSGLAWIDAGTAAAPIIKTATICFGLMAFIGLVYLPFRHANSWRGRKLESRGYELVAVANASSPGKAIAKVRAASGFE